VAGVNWTSARNRTGASSLQPEKLELVGVCLIDAIEKSDWPSVAALLATGKSLLAELQDSREPIDEHLKQRLIDGNTRALCLLEEKRKVVCGKKAQRSQQKRATEVYRAVTRG
jgi:hypothetical protein